MVEFNLHGKSFKAKSEATNVKEFKISRWNPNKADKNTSQDSYELDLDDCGLMVLDALVKIKNEVRSIEPWLQTDTPAPPDEERRQSKEERVKIDGCGNTFCASVTPRVVPAINRRPS